MPPPPAGQLVPGAGQLHAPLVHLPAVPQERPHPPQFAGSDVGSVHVPPPPPKPPPPQTMSPVGQLHTPLTQLAPLAHLRPHAPQLFGSVARTAHPPPGHATAPVPHVQTPAAQEPPAQFFPQPPQLLVSLVGSTQLPAHAIFGVVHVIGVSLPPPSVGVVSLPPAVSVAVPSPRAVSVAVPSPGETSSPTEVSSTEES